MMKQTTAMACLYVRPVLTITHHVNRQSRPVFCIMKAHFYKNKLFSCQQKQQIQEDNYYRLGWVSVTLHALVRSRLPLSDPPISCGTTCWPLHHRWLVAVFPRGNVGFRFEFFPAVFLEWGVVELGNVVEIDESYFSLLKCNCGLLRAILWVFVGSNRSDGDLYCTCGWTFRWDIARHH
jgi:hypothetical protein